MCIIHNKENITKELELLQQFPDETFNTLDTLISLYQNRKNTNEFPSKSELAKFRDEIKETKVISEIKENIAAGQKYVRQARENWTRQSAYQDSKTLHIFTDNTDRDSGRGEIDDNTEYAKKYGKGKHFPEQTAAVVRGLDNAKPVSTQRWYHDGAKREAGRWQDSDFIEFKKVIDDEFRDIIEAWRTGKYTKILFPGEDGLFNGAISMISKERTPLLYSYLNIKLQQLKYEIGRAERKSSPVEHTENLNTFVNHSGGAIGSDSYWGEVGEKYGVKSNHYYAEGEKTPNGNTALTKEQLSEADEHLKKANEKLKRKFPANSEKTNNLLRRNWFQVKNADAVFAVGTMVNGKINGGTAWAVQMAIDNGKPVYVFDQNSNTWYTYVDGKWTATETPTLTQNFAGIGTRELSENGKKAIEEVYKKSVSNSQTITDEDDQALSLNSNSDVVETTGEEDLNEALTGGETETTKESSWEDKYNKDATETTGIASLGEIEKVEAAFTPQKRRDRVQLIANLFSRRIDALIEQEKQRLQKRIENEKNPEIQRELQKSMKDINRLFIIRKYSPKGIFNQILDEVFKPYAEASDEALTQAELKKINALKAAAQYTEEQKLEIAQKKAAYKKAEYQKVVDNYKALAEETNCILMVTEGIVLDFDTVVDGEADFNDNDYSDDEEEGQENRAKDGWMIKFREVSSHESLSVKVRRFLSTVPKLNYRGKYDKDDLGFNRYLDASMVHASLMDRLSVIQEPDDIFIVLDKAGQKIPWIRQVVKALRQDTQLFSAFYQDFNKDFLDYWVQSRQEGYDGRVKTKTIQTNKTEGSGFITSMIRDNYESGNMLVQDSIYDSNGEVVKENAKKGAEMILELVNQFNKLNTNEEKNAKVSTGAVLNKIQKALKMLGMEIDDDIVIKALTDTETASKELTIESPTVSFFSSLLTIFNGVADGKVKDKTDEDGNKIQGDLLNTFGTAYNSVAMTFAPYMEDMIESSTREGDKSYYAHTVPNYVGIMMRKLTNSMGDEARFQKFMQEEYGKYSWFKDKKTGEWKNELIKLLATDENFRKGFKHKVLLNSGKVEYDKWDDLDYTLVLLNEYWGEPENTKSNDQWCWIPLPVPADSPSAEFFRMKRYTDATSKAAGYKGYKDEILDHMINLVNQEYNRIQTVCKRYHQRANGDTSIAVIANYDIQSKKTAGGKTIITNKGGSEFKFLPALNTYKYKDNGESVIERIKRLKEAGAQDTEIKESIREALEDTMEDSFEEFYRKVSNNGTLELTEQGKYKYLNFGYSEKYNERTIKSIDAAIELLNKVGVDQDLINRLAYIKQMLSSKQALNDKFANNTFAETMAKLEEAVTNNQIASDAVNALERNLKINNPAKEGLREYFYNHEFNSSQLIQLLATDLAYYKNITDFFKRIKEVHTPTNRFNTKAVYKGERVGREIEKTVYVQDDMRVAPDLDYIHKMVIKQWKKGHFNDYQAAFILAKFGYSNHTITDKFGKAVKYVKVNGTLVKTDLVNVTDAQAYRSLSSYRAMMIMQDSWTDEMEEAYHRIKAGKSEAGDFFVFWQTQKPFLYGQYGVDSGVGDGEIKMGVQHKNSEFLLLAMYESLGSAVTEKDENGKESRLAGLNRFMEEHDIDVIQYESAVKVGLQGVVNISDAANGQEVYDRLVEASGVKGELNTNVVHMVNYADYGNASRTPEHLFDMLQGIGTQLRKLISADISPEAVIELKVNGKTVKKTKAEWMQLYNEITTENILEKFTELDKEFSDIKNVEKLLQEELRSSPRYGIELRRACTINPETGTFNLALCDPVQSMRIQQLLNSIIKSRVTKQKTRGGSAIQVSSFGLSEDLHIIYGKDENGNERIEGFECYLPAYSRKLIEPLMGKDGKLDINKLPDSLRRIIGYRTPTEDKYSMLNLYIKGFLPQQNGSAIMLPAEITTIAGSDFDKLTMLK